MVKDTVKVARGSLAMLAAAVAMVAVACGGDDNNETPLVATHIAINSGSSGQSAEVGHALPNPVSVTVTDQNGNAFSGATVTWTVVGAGGTVDAATSTTDATGNASVHWTLGNVAGTDSLTAALANGASVTITASATATSSPTIVKVSGDSQSVKAGTATQPLVVKVTDASGTAMSGATVTWAVTGGGTLSSTSTTTDATGQTQVTLTTAAAAGTMTVTATGPSGSKVTFTVTGTP